MAYARELDDIRQELRKDIAGTIIFWPKVDGANVQVETDGTFEVFDPSGTSLEGPTTVDGTLVGDVDRYDIPVAAISTLDEGYYVKLLWEEASTSVQRIEIIPFDVVATPFYGPSVSLNDLLEERPDVYEILDRLGQRLGYTAGDTAAETAAAIYAVRALVEVDQMLRTHINDRATNETVETAAPYNIDRAHAIFNREILNRVERKIAMKLIFQADRNVDEAEFWEIQSQHAWRAMPPIEFDSDGDLIPDKTVEDFGRVVHMRRVQG